MSDRKEIAVPMISRLLYFQYLYAVRFSRAWWFWLLVASLQNTEDVLTFLFGFTATAVWRRSNANSMPTITQKFKFSMIFHRWLCMNRDLMMISEEVFGTARVAQYILHGNFDDMYSSSEMVDYGCCLDNCGHHARYSGRKHLCGCRYLRERGERV